jgi:hypothetical protein
MSLSAARQSKTLRKHCQSCHARKARFRYRGHVRADRDHTLCFECYRAEKDRRRARSAAPNRALKSPFDDAMLSPRAIAHRRVMLAHLSRQLTRPSTEIRWQRSRNATRFT